MKKIKILGCGLSGMAAAINLAKKGFEVEIYEKNKDVGMRFHGDVQGIENWTSEEDALAFLERMNIKVNFEITPFSTITLTNAEVTREFEFQRPLFYLVKRGSFEGSIDWGLKEQTIRSGVKINFGQTFSVGQADIIATGPDPQKIGGAVKGIVFKTERDNIGVGIINDDYAHKGYSYLFIVNGYACICTAIARDFEKLESCFEKTKRYFVEKYKLKINSPQVVGGVGSFSLNGPYKKGKALFVGEAAGIQDFLAGFGMRTAITSGYLAAESIVENKDYEKVAKKWFGDYLKAGIANRYLWERAGASNYMGVFDKLAKIVDPVEFLRSMYNFNVLDEATYLLAHEKIKREYPNLDL